MKPSAFNIYEIEHQGDEEHALEELRRVGVTDIVVTARDYDSGEAIRVSCCLPDHIRTKKDLEIITDLCL